VVNIPSVPEIITVNSEALQTVIRDLLPSQNGFGSELQASNVITPIIDLTPTAEGSTLRQDLQTALSYSSQTPFRVVNATTTLINSPGFYRVFGTATQLNNTTVNFELLFQLSDGITPKEIWNMETIASVTNSLTLQFDFVVFLAAGDSLIAQSTGAGSVFVGSTRQIADGAGDFVSPGGFPL